MGTEGTEITSGEEAVRVAELDGLRGLAALWVLLYHASNPQLSAWIPPLLYRPFFEAGNLGVAAFFTLSGFLMARIVATADVGVRFGLRFLVRRFARLTPPYYAAIVAALVVAGLSSLIEGEPFEVAGPITVWRLFAHVFFLPGVIEVTPISSSYWALYLEVAMYGAFIALMGAVTGLRRLGFESVVTARAMVFAPVSAYAVFRWIGSVDPVGTPGLEAAATAFPTFLLGVFAQWVRSMGDLRAEVVAAVGGSLLAGYSLVMGDRFGLVAAVTAIGLVTGFPVVGRALGGPALQWVGRVSFSLYLIHPIVFGSVDYLAERSLTGGGSGRATVVLVVGTVTSLAAAAVMWHLVEAPAQRWARRLVAVSG